MPLNLTKTYAALLELAHLNDKERIQSLQRIFQRDIEENLELNFKGKTIRPVKGEEPAMALLFKHLTTEEIEEKDENGRPYPKRVFEWDRSKRLHWIRFHIEDNKKDNIEIFSVEERDQKKRRDIIRTYIYDVEQKYIIVFDPQRSQQDYYLITAYFLNKEYGEKKIKNLLRKRLPDLY